MDGCKALTQAEIETLAFGGKLMALEVGIRFLTDYLEGDTYFRTTRPGQNLDRCRTQLKLVNELEKHDQEFNQFIQSLSNSE